MSVAQEPVETVSSAARVALPLKEHPLLDFESDFSRIAIVPIARGEEPFVEIVGPVPAGRPVHVRGEGGVTRVRMDIPWSHTKEKWWEGSFWEAGFWEGLFFEKKGHSRIVLHVPADVRARIRSAAARIDVSDLSGCDLSIEADAGAITLDRIAGRLDLATQAGRIDGQRISGALSVRTSAASVRLDVLSLDPGRHKISANMGSVKLALARGMPVRVDARTQMGSARVDYPEDKNANIVLDVEADLGSIRIGASEATYVAREGAAAPPSSDIAHPYRAAALTPGPSPADEIELEKVLARVADGTLSPAEAKELLRALGWP